MQAKPYTQEELDDIFEMLKQGATYKEIAEMTGRSAAAVQVKVSSFRKEKSDAAEKKCDAEQEKIVIGTKTLIKQKTLEDFTVREMIKNLYDRGCRLKIRNNKPVIVTECIINLSDIIA